MGLSSMSGASLSGIHAQAARLAAIANSVASGESEERSPENFTQAETANHDLASDMLEMSDAEMAYKANAAAFAKYGGRFLVRGGAQDVVEGDMRPRCVVIEFSDIEAARACYHSPEYQAALALRLPCSVADIAIVEGYETA